jgi:putative transposase
MGLESEGSGGRPDRHPLAHSFLRKQLPHVRPEWVGAGSLYFITICCERRGENQLCQLQVGSGLISAAERYHHSNRWFVRLLLLMPDHLHALIAFPQAEAMSEVLRNWKSYTTREFDVRWQRGYFDRRIRDAQNWRLKAEYIRQNPVRRGLIADGTQWPYVLEN